MRLAVVGSGTMGKSLVEILSQTASLTRLIWMGRNAERLRIAHDDVRKAVDLLVRKRRLDQDKAANALARICPVSNLHELDEADFVLEAVTESMQVKREIFASLDRILPSHAILATNTSSLSVTALGSATARPQQVIGLHFFNPAPVMRLVEVVCGKTTSEETIAKATELAVSAGKQPVRVKDIPGFIVNRMLFPMINEAIGILAEGAASAADIDVAMRLGANHPLGPLALSDLIGNDVSLSIMDTLYAETGDHKYQVNPLLRKMVSDNLLGRKVGKGFFDYERASNE